MNIYLVRHGQTDWNKLKKIQGHTDIPLNDTGRRQAEKIKSQVSNLNVKSIISSDLLRAKEKKDIEGEKNLILHSKQQRET